MQMEKDWKMKDVHILRVYPILPDYATPVVKRRYV